MKSLPFEYPMRWADIGPQLREAIRRNDEGLWNEVVAVLEDRDRRLEDFLSRTPIVWDRDASATRLRSKPWTAKDFGQAREWNVELGQDDAGDDEVLDHDLDIELHINGTMARTMTLPTGEVYVEYDGELPETEPGDRVTLYCEELGFDLVSTVSF